MRKLGIAASIAGLIAFGAVGAWAQAVEKGPKPSPAVKMTQAECQSIWNKADAAKAGSLSSAQSQPYVSDFKSIDANGDGKLASSEFLAGCQKGLVHDSASTGAGSGTSGSGAEPSSPSEGAAPPSKEY